MPLKILGENETPTEVGCHSEWGTKRNPITLQLIMRFLTARLAGETIARNDKRIKLFKEWVVIPNEARREIP